MLWNIHGKAWAFHVNTLPQPDALAADDRLPGILLQLHGEILVHGSPDDHADLLVNVK